MADTYKVKVLKQAVFHDGKSMIVLSPETKKNPKPINPKVEHRFIAGLIEQGSIDAPQGWKEPVKDDDANVVKDDDANVVEDDDANVVEDDAASEVKSDKAP